MDRIRRTFTRTEAAAAPPPKREASAAPPGDSFVGGHPLLQQAKAEHARLKADFETRFGKPIAALQTEHAKAQKDLARFEAVKKLDSDEWGAHLDYARKRLEDPDSLSPEDLIDLRDTLEALQARPASADNVHLTAEQEAQLKFLMLALHTHMYAVNPTEPEAAPETAEPSIHDAEKHALLNSLGKIEHQLSSQAQWSPETTKLYQEHIQLSRQLLKLDPDYAVDILKDIQSKSYELDIHQRLEQSAKQLAKHQGPELKTLQEAEARLALLQSEHLAHAVLADHAQRLQATAGYQAHAKKLKGIINQTLLAKQRLIKLEENKSKTALGTSGAEFQDQINSQTKELEKLHGEFKKALHDLEQHDLDAKRKKKDGDPYLSAVTLPAPTELVREYQLARHGVSSIADAYHALFAGAANLNPAELWKSVSLETLKTKLKDAKDLARDYPLECADVAANLAHTYSILTLSGPMDEAKAVLDRRTMENMVVDAVLGQNQPLYSTGELKDIELNQLALADFCDRAPYIAGVLMQDRMTGAAAAKTAASWIPGLGSWAPVQWAAGTAGAIAEVKAQKEAARMLSRKYEVMANSALSAIKGYKNGGMSGAVKEAATYAATRQALQNAGDVFRAAVEGNLTGELLRGWRQAPGTEAVKATAAWGTGLAAGATTFGGSVAAAGGAVTASTLLWPATVALVAGLAGRTVANVVHNQLKSADTKRDEQQQQTAERLAAACQRMAGVPALQPAEFADAAKLATSDAQAKKAIEIVDAKLQAQQAREYQSLADEAGVEPQVIAQALEKLSGS